MREQYRVHQCDVQVSVAIAPGLAVKLIRVARWRRVDLADVVSEAMFAWVLREERCLTMRQQVALDAAVRALETLDDVERLQKKLHLQGF